MLLRPLNSPEFRDACSGWLSASQALVSMGEPALRRIFHHEADGRPMEGLSPFRFHAEGHDGFIQAIGAEPTALLRSVWQELRRVPAPLPWLSAPQWSDTVNSLAQADAARQFWAPDLVVCRNATQHQRWSAASEQARAEHVQALLQKGLERQMCLLMQSQSPNIFLEPPQVRLISRERVIPRLRTTQANAFVRLASVAFTAPLDLQGHWAAGGLVSRGYGRILPLA